MESSAGTLSIATKIFAKNFFYFTNGFYILLTHITILSSTLFEKLVGGGESTGYILAAGYISSYFSFIFFFHSSSRFLVGNFGGVRRLNFSTFLILKIWTFVNWLERM